MQGLFSFSKLHIYPLLAIIRMATLFYNISYLFLYVALDQLRWENLLSYLERMLMMMKMKIIQNDDKARILITGVSCIFMCEM